MNPVEEAQRRSNERKAARECHMPSNSEQRARVATHGAWRCRPSPRDTLQICWLLAETVMVNNSK